MPEPKSPLLEEPKDILKPEYSEEEKKYLGGLQQRLVTARNQRDTVHQEFDGMTYTQYHESNERWANSFIAPKKNKEDTNFKSGTVRQKLLTLLSALNNLNLSPDVSAFDKDNLKVQALGDSMEDIFLKTSEYESDEEKKMLRQYEMLKQGTVFVEEIQDEKEESEKKLSIPFDGKIASAKWTNRLKKAFSYPCRNLINGLNVYLGDITIYELEKQPFIFTVDAKSYAEAEKTYGGWERWKFVPKNVVKFAPTETMPSYSSPWQLTEVQKDHVEIVRYQDKWSNEFCVLINGVLMTPVGLPLPWGYQRYNIAQQNLEPIHARFAYGNSFCRKIKNEVELLDEMLRLAVLKTQKSFMPPYLNISGRVLTSRIFMPGKITQGVPPNSLVPVSDKESQGVTQSEFAMISNIKEVIDTQTVSPTFSGQAAKSRTSATEIIEMQRQAKMVLGLMVFAASLLEWKLSWLRLENILQNWFQPIDQQVDEARGVLKDVYRTTNIERSIGNKGLGRRMVIPSKKMPTPEGVRLAQEALTEEQGQPVELIFLNPDEIKSSKLQWFITITPKEKQSSDTQKLMFRAFMEDAQVFGPTLNMDYLGEEFASVWQKSPDKLFKKGVPPPPIAPAENPSSQVLSPRMNLPSPEKNAGQQMRNTLSQ